MWSRVDIRVISRPVCTSGTRSSCTCGGETVRAMRRASVGVCAHRIACHVDRVARAKIIELTFDVIYVDEIRSTGVRRQTPGPVDPARAGRAGERPADHERRRRPGSDCDNALCNLQIGISYAPLRASDESSLRRADLTSLIISFRIRADRPSPSRPVARASYGLPGRSVL